MEGPNHLLSLKVMRVSRPALAGAWEPFYSSSPSFSARSTASILSLQGSAPLPGHPKTLRDLSNPTNLLTLPAAFGSIQLGETFTSCLCINNEAAVDVQAVSMKVEMQTATTKTTLADIGGPDFTLAPGGVSENVVSHEIKELGQHVLACTVSYRLPSSVRHAPAGSVDPANPHLATFRKFYKFAVTNPLSVKTKVHVPRSPSALLSRTEREKVFLEVHIQNLTQDAMWFERIQFEPSDGWQHDSSSATPVVSESLMQPQDTRQFLYVLSPLSIPDFPVTHAPGSILPLGRLDISWRSGFGEPGRLITSTLSRRIPLPPAAPAPTAQSTAPHPPASAVPPYLQRKASVSGGGPIRSGSPQLPIGARPATPPLGPVPARTGSPFRNRPASVAPSARPQSPSLVGANVPGTPAPAPAAPPPPPDFDVDLVVRTPPPNPAPVEEPVTLGFTLSVSAPSPPAGRRRVLTLAVQHVQPPRVAPAPRPAPPNPHEPFTPRLPSSGFSTPTTVVAPKPDFARALDEKLLVASPRVTERAAGVAFPPPFSATVRAGGALFLGGSVTVLEKVVVAPREQREPVPLEREKASLDESTATVGPPPPAPRSVVSRDFELTWLPVRTGFVTVGGVRVLLVDDHTTVEDGEDAPATITAEARVLRQWDVVAEMWVVS